MEESSPWAVSMARSKASHTHGLKIIAPTKLLLLAVFSVVALAQNSDGITTASPAPTAPTTTASTVPSLSASLVRPLSSIVTSTTTPSPSGSISPSMSHPLGSDSPSDQNDTAQHRNEYAFNYYFLFLVMVGVAIAIGLWWIERRRRRQKESMRLSGQQALARDLDGWVDTRRWMHGRWRQNLPAAMMRREEGLDEHGEAPPPYEPKGDATVTQHSTEGVQVSVDLAVPLRTLSRTGVDTIRPPTYRQEPETARVQSSDSAVHNPGNSGGDSSAADPSQISGLTARNT